VATRDYELTGIAGLHPLCETEKLLRAGLETHGEADNFRIVSGVGNGRDVRRRVEGGEGCVVSGSEQGRGQITNR
jgi:hypothetical protein